MPKETLKKLRHTNERALEDLKKEIKDLEKSIHVCADESLQKRLVTKLEAAKKTLRDISADLHQTE